jgi:DNA-binding CsgD family transcriptional regulator
MGFSIEQIYECLLDDEALSKLPELMAQIGKARSAVMHWRHHDGGFEVMGHSYFSQAIIDMTPEVLPIDPWTKACTARPNELLRLDLVMPENFFENSPACKKLFFDNGDDTTQAMGMVIKSHHGEGVLGVHRGRTQPRFEADDQDELASVLRHFERVLLLRGELVAGQRAVANAQALIDGLSVAVLTVRADLSIVSSNAAAETVLKRGDGLTIRHGALFVLSASARTRFMDAVARATGRAGRQAAAMQIPRDGDNGSYLLNVAPLVNGGTAMALIVFRDPDSIDDTLSDRLRCLFGLTQAEAVIAVELSRGRSMDEIRRIRGVSLNTLKTQLKALVSKMGCVRQAEVAGIVAALPTIRCR